MLHEIGRLIIIVAVFLLLIGAILLLVDRIPFVGKLPGDIFIRRKSFAFYFPLATCILLSIILTLLARFFVRR